MNAAAPPSLGSLLAPSLLAAGAAVLALVLLTGAPGVLTGERLLGTGTPDLWGHVWIRWWRAEALFEGQPTWPTPTAHPEGQALWLNDPVWPLLLAPLTRLGGPVLAYHVDVLVHVALIAGALTAFLRRHAVPALLAGSAGVLAAVSPFSRGAVASAVPEMLALGWVPLFALLLEDGLEGRRRAAAGAAVVGVVMVFDGLYAVLPGALVGIAVLVAAGVRRQVPWSRLLLRALPAVAATGLAVLVVYRGFGSVEHAGMTNPIALPSFDGGTAWVVAPQRVTDLLNPFAPAPLLPSAERFHMHRHTTYLGWALLIPALVVARRSWRARVLLLVGGVALLLALGPRLTLAGRILLDVPLPGALLSVVGANHAYRIAGLTMLSVTAAAALGWAALWSRHRAAVGALVAVAFLEGLLLAPLEPRLPTIPNPASDVERWLAAQPEPGAVVDLPRDRECERTRGPFPDRFLFLQTVHGRAVSSGRCAESPAVRQSWTLAALDRWILATWDASHTYRGPRPPELPFEVPSTVTDPPALDPARAARDREALREAGFRWLLLDLGSVPREARNALLERLTGWLGAPARSDGVRHVFHLGEEPAEASAGHPDPP